VADKKPTRATREGQLRAHAAVWAVASQLALHGRVPHFPGVDFGYDLLLENGIRLQVKMSMLRQPRVNNYVEGAYCFNLRRSVWDASTNRSSRKEVRSYAGVADFFVLWGVDEDRFFIVPTSIKNHNLWCTSRNYVSRSNNSKFFGQTTEKRLAEMENRWDLLDVDRAVEEITSGVGVPSLEGK
jgi:hypothetical protein